MLNRVLMVVCELAALSGISSTTIVLVGRGPAALRAKASNYATLSAATIGLCLGLLMLRLGLML